jgi:hypothetical protein
MYRRLSQFPGWRDETLSPLGEPVRLFGYAIAAMGDVDSNGAPDIVATAFNAGIGVGGGFGVFFLNQNGSIDTYELTQDADMLALGHEIKPLTIILAQLLLQWI